MIEQELSEMSDEEIADLGARIDAEQARLTDEADRAEEAAKKAAEDFRVSPSPKTHAASAVAAQVAKNARQEATEYELANAPAMAERTRRRQIRRLAEIVPLVDERAIADAAAQRIAELIKDFTSAMQTECDVLIRELGQRNSLVGEANSLEKSVGTGRHRPNISLEYATNNRVREALAAMLGDAEAAYIGHASAGVSLRCSADSQKALFNMRLRFGTASNREVM